MKLIIREYEQGEEIGYDEYEYGELVNEYEIDELALFVFDDCHKIYIIEDKDDIASAKEKWGEDTKFYNIDELPSIWENTCPLRFISNWKLDRQDYVRQFHLAEFEFID